MALTDFVVSSITTGGVTPSRAGFGTPLLLAQNLPVGFGPARKTKTYTQLSDMTADGFAATHPAYLMASKLTSQPTRVPSWKVGRRTSGVRTVALTVTSAVLGDVYSIVIDGKTITYTVPGASTTTTVAAAIAALVAPTAQTVTASASLAVITLIAASGTIYDVSDWTSNFQVSDNSADPGLAADLAAIMAVDSDWYGICADATSKVEAQALAVFGEANKKLTGISTSDYAVMDGVSTTDIAYLLKTSSYFYTFSVHHNTQLLSYANVAAMGNRFPFDPGSDTWAFKTLPGVRAAVMTGAQEQAVWAKNANTYTVTSSVASFQKGQVASGEWLDVVRFKDWLDAELKVRIFALFLSQPKIPYTDPGVDSVVSVIQATLTDGVKRGGLAAGSTSVTAPKVADVDPTTRGTRLLPNLTWGARLAGAIQKATISGVISV